MIIKEKQAVGVELELQTSDVQFLEGIVKCIPPFECTSNYWEGIYTSTKQEDRRKKPI